MVRVKTPDEPLLTVLQVIIRLAVRALAVLMTVVIVLGVVDVGWELYLRLFVEEPRYILTISDILATFGTFMAVLIAIEIFVNIVLYLQEDAIHVRLVLATALMAVARKVIIVDFDTMTAMEVISISAALIASAVGYWIAHYTTEKFTNGNTKH